MIKSPVALVQPPLVVGASYHLTEPLGLLLVASALRQRDEKAQLTLMDLSLDTAEGSLPCGSSLIDAAVATLAGLDVGTYAFSVQCVDLPVAVAIARRVKRIHPHRTIIFGGHQATLLGSRLREAFPFIDRVISGHGEQLTGLGIDEWVRPAYDLAPPFVRYAAVSRQPTGLVEVARGCPYECTYCSIPQAHGRRVSYKPIELIMAEIDALQERGYEEIHLVHDTLTVNRRFVAQLITAFKNRQHPARWTGMTRADLVDQAMLRDLASAGCEGLLVGIDAASPETLRLINKHAWRYPPLLDLATWHRDAGLSSKFYFLVGFPGDGVECVEQSLYTAAKASVIDPGSCHIQSPRVVPGTPFADAVGPRATIDQETPYAQWLIETVGDSGEPWDLIAGHPDIFATYYAPHSSIPPATVRALNWLASRLLAALPLTMTALGEQQRTLALFDELARGHGGSSWSALSDEKMFDMTRDAIATLAPALAEVFRFERWLHQGTGVLMSDFDYGASRSAVANRRPLSPELFGRQRIYKK